jgi:hypothetical protein
MEQKHWIFFEFFSVMGISEIMLLGLFVVGFIIYIWNKKTKLIILFCVPIVLHLFLSTFRLYPFCIRLILYTLPCIILIASFGLEFIVKVGFSDLKIEKFRLLAIFIPVMFLLIGCPVKMKKEEIKKSIKYVQKNITEDETIYVYSRAIPAFRYYDGIGFMNIQAHIIEGKYNRHGILFDEGDLSELDQLHGKDWLLFAHAQYGDDEQMMIHYVDSMGYVKLNEFKTVESSAYLYDFGKLSK